MLSIYEQLNNYRAYISHNKELFIDIAINCGFQNSKLFPTLMDNIVFDTLQIQISNKELSTPSKNKCAITSVRNAARKLLNALNRIRKEYPKLNEHLHDIIFDQPTFFYSIKDQLIKLRDHLNWSSTVNGYGEYHKNHIAECCNKLIINLNGVNTQHIVYIDQLETSVREKHFIKKCLKNKLRILIDCCRILIPNKINEGRPFDGVSRYLAIRLLHLYETQTDTHPTLYTTDIQSLPYKSGKNRFFLFLEKIYPFIAILLPNQKSFTQFSAIICKILPSYNAVL